MTIAADLITYLRAQTDITDLTGTRIRSYEARQRHGGTAPPLGDELPYITVRRTSGTTTHCLSGSSGIAFYNFEINCWAATPESADAVAEAVRNNLDTYNGTMGNTTVAAPLLQNHFLAADSPVDGSERSLFLAGLDYQIGHTEAVPS